MSASGPRPMMLCPAGIGTSRPASAPDIDRWREPGCGSSGRRRRSVRVGLPQILAHAGVRREGDLPVPHRGRWRGHPGREHGLRPGGRLRAGGRPDGDADDAASGARGGPVRGAVVRHGRRRRAPLAGGAQRPPQAPPPRGRAAVPQSLSPVPAVSIGGMSGSSDFCVPWKENSASAPSPSTSTSTIWPGPTSP